MAKPDTLRYAAEHRTDDEAGMISIGQVWDDAVEAVRGRLGLIAPIAIGAVFLPSVVQAALEAWFPAVPGEAGRAGLRFVLTVAMTLLTFWGALAITALVSHPDTTSAQATRQASARLPALIGVSIVMGLAGFLILIPVAIILLVTVGIEAAGSMQAGTMPTLPAATTLTLSLYLLVALGLLLWLLARLLPIVPTVLHERIGLRAIGRAFSLTRGLGWRLVGALLLYSIVLAIASGAATLVVGTVLGLALGNENAATAAFLGAIVGSVVATVLGVLAYAFSARLYARLAATAAVNLSKDEPRPA